eukprot:2375850-Amphidinium_carterae.1
MELYLSFLCWRGLHRVFTNQAEADDGGWVSHQLEAFRQGVLSFIVLTSCQAFLTVQSAGHRAEGLCSTWGPRFHMPKFQL